MKKKVLALVLVVALVAALTVGLVACNKDNGIKVHDKVNDGEFKVGLICLHGSNSTYDKNFIDAMTAAVAATTAKTGVKLIIEENIPEDNTCYETACNLADEGCDLIFADSFGHEAFIMQAALEYPYVRFCHATGTSEHVKGLSNFHNAFASIYEGRYLAGIAAGKKLNEMAGGTATGADAKMGYVGAFPYAEVVSGFTAFYLGAKSVCPEVTMDVQYTYSWYDETAEQETANTLITVNKCKLISQHADSMGAPNACEEKGIPNVTYNIATGDKCPNTYLIGSKINWQPYFEYIINQTFLGREIDTDYVGTLESGSVQVFDPSANAAEGTQKAIDDAKAALNDGSLKVFDFANFEVVDKDGKVIPLETLKKEWKADVHPDEKFEGDTNVILTEGETTYFAESVFRSAPYFTLSVKGINILADAK